jgi:hypothetical protein
MADKLKARYSEITAKLQDLYQGRAREFRGAPPPGMWPTDALMQSMEATAVEIKRHEQVAKDLEHQLLVLPPVLQKPQQWYKASPNDKRNGLIMEVAKVCAQKRIAEDTMTLLKAVKPASPQYLAELSDLFKEARALRVQLLEEHQLYLEDQL